MGRLFKPHYTRSVPDGTPIVVVGNQKLVSLKIRGVVRDCPVKEINGRLRALVVLEDRWAVEWTDENGKTRSRTIGRDKRAATAALARYEERAARLRHGLPDLAAAGRARGAAITGMIDEYLDVLAGGDTAEGYRQHTRARLYAIARGCGWQTWGDVSADSLIRYLGRLRDEAWRRKSAEKAQENRCGLSPSTINGYLRAAKAFANWYAERLRERSPLKGVKGYPEQKDRRRSPRILTDEEFDRLLAATSKAPRRYRCLVSPPNRVILYQVAAYSGLRASELARLTRESLDLGPQPGIRVYGKGKREEFTPIPGHLAKLLTPWIAGKKPKERLWPGQWADQRHQIKWIKRDAARAELGPGVTFHGIRRRFVTALLRAGNAVDVVRRMARHKDLQTTMSYYAEITPADLQRAAESLVGPKAG